MPDKFSSRCIGDDRWIEIKVDRRLVAHSVSQLGIVMRGDFKENESIATLRVRETIGEDDALVVKGDDSLRA